MTDLLNKKCRSGVVAGSAQFEFNINMNTQLAEPRGAEYTAAAANGQALLIGGSDARTRNETN